MLLTWVAHFSGGVRHRSGYQLLMLATFAASVTEAGASWAASQASGVPAARRDDSAFWVNPVPKRLRNRRSREVATVDAAAVGGVVAGCGAGVEEGAGVVGAGVVVAGAGVVGAGAVGVGVLTGCVGAGFGARLRGRLRRGLGGGLHGLVADGVTALLALLALPRTDDRHPCPLVAWPAEAQV